MRPANPYRNRKPGPPRRVGVVPGAAPQRVLIPAGYMPGNLFAGEFMENGHDSNRLWYRWFWPR
ncbi:MAG: hypothetical protein KJN72_11785 [Woeseia sp.]|nr:hypothetical protein [Woeseia sp.]